MGVLVQFVIVTYSRWLHIFTARLQKFKCIE